MINNSLSKCTIRLDFQNFLLKMILLFLFLFSVLSAYSGKSYKNFGYYEFFVESAKDLKTLRLLDQRFHCTWLSPHKGEIKF